MGHYKPRIRKIQTFCYIIHVSLIPNSNFRFLIFCGLILEKSPQSTKVFFSSHRVAVMRRQQRRWRRRWRRSTPLWTPGWRTQILALGIAGPWSASLQLPPRSRSPWTLSSCMYAEPPDAEFPDAEFSDAELPDAVPTDAVPTDSAPTNAVPTGELGLSSEGLTFIAGYVAAKCRHIDATLGSITSETPVTSKGSGQSARVDWLDAGWAPCAITRLFSRWSWAAPFAESQASCAASWTSNRRGLTWTRVMRKLMSTLLHVRLRWLNRKRKRWRNRPPFLRRGSKLVWCLFLRLRLLPWRQQSRFGSMCVLRSGK